MKLLLDTHLLLCAARQPDRLSADVRALIESVHQQYDRAHFRFNVADPA